MFNKSTAEILSAGILWGMIGLLVRELSGFGLTPLQIASVRLMTAAVLLTGFTALRAPSKLKIRLRDVWMFAGTGIVSVVLFNCCYFFAVIRGEASIAVVLLYTSPIFITVISRFTFGERFTPAKLLGTALTVTGCVLISGFIGSGYRVSAAVFAAGLGSGFFYALYTIFGKYALEKYSSLTVTVYTFIFGAIGSLPLSHPVALLRTAAASPRLIVGCIAIGTLCTLLPYCLYTAGLRDAEAGRAAILAAVEPMVGAVIGMTLLGESRDVVKISGIALILSAIIIMNLPANKKSTKEKSNGKKH